MPPPRRGWPTTAPNPDYWQRNTPTVAPLTTADSLFVGDTATPTTPFFLEVNGKKTGKALVALTETGDQNILTASTSASTTVFNLGRTGLLSAAAAQGLDVLSAGELKLGDTTATTVSLGTTAATTLNLGAGGALTRAINIGPGTGVDTINIGTGGTGADVISIGSANAGNASVKSAAVLNLTGGASSVIDFPPLDVATSGTH